jgi:hypothetical protein
MPVLASVSGASIVMYYNDHPPPHFHAIHGADEAIIAIATNQALQSSLSPPTLQSVRQWASQRQGALALEWAKARSHLPLGKL